MLDKTPLSRQMRQGLVTCGAISAAVVSVCIASSQPAIAHHPFGGETPDSILTGLLSGLGHPVIGLDHLAFVIALGAVAFGLQPVLNRIGARSSQADGLDEGERSLRKTDGLLIVLVFLAAAAIGSWLHVQGLDLLGAETVISLSVLLAGLLLVWQQRFAVALLLSLSAIAGLYHGYAYGEAIIGAEPTPTVAYLLGFTGAQAAIAMSSGACVRRYCLLATAKLSSVTAVSSSTVFPWVMTLGGGIGGIGFTFLFEVLLG